MNKEKLLGIISAAIAKPIDASAIDENTSLKDIGITSISLIQTVVLIEEELGCEVSDEFILLEPLVKFEDLWLLINKIQKG